MKFYEAMKEAVENGSGIKLPVHAEFMHWDSVKSVLVYPHAYKPNTSVAYVITSSDVYSDQWSVKEKLFLDGILLLDFNRKKEVLQILEDNGIPARVTDSKIQYFNQLNWHDFYHGRKIKIQRGRFYTI